MTLTKIIKDFTIGAFVPGSVGHNFAMSSLVDSMASEIRCGRRETIVFLEKGKYNPSLKLAHDVAKVLKTTIEDLFIFN